MSSAGGSSDGPKLFTNKPKKSKLKPSSSNPISMTTPASESRASAAPAPPPPPPPPAPPSPHPKESFIRRYRFIWPLVLVVNFSIGAYVLLRTSQKGKSGTTESDTTVTTPSTTPGSTVSATVNENPVSTPPIENVPRPPIPQDQQRELFKWILEEKRRVKPRDAEERKRIDEEKAILKQFIRAKNIPDL